MYGCALASSSNTSFICTHCGAHSAQKCTANALLQRTLMNMSGASSSFSLQFNEISWIHHHLQAKHVHSLFNLNSTNLIINHHLADRAGSLSSASKSATEDTAIALKDSAFPHKWSHSPYFVSVLCFFKAVSHTLTAVPGMFEDSEDEEILAKIEESSKKKTDAQDHSSLARLSPVL